MNHEEAKLIFTEHICGHWPNWPQGIAELSVWVKALSAYDYALAREAIDELYGRWDKERYPKTPVIMAAVRKHAQRRQRKSPIVPRYEIWDRDGRRRWHPFSARAEIAKQELETEAQRLCELANRTRPGRGYYIHWLHIPVGEEPDTGYYGPDAKERAFEEILDGPDTPGRRWLENYLAAKNAREQPEGARDQAIAKAREQKDALNIGAVVNDAVPF